MEGAGKIIHKIESCFAGKYGEIVVDLLDLILRLNALHHLLEKGKSLFIFHFQKSPGESGFDQKIVTQVRIMQLFKGLEKRGIFQLAHQKKTRRDSAFVTALEYILEFGSIEMSCFPKLGEPHESIGHHPRDGRF